MRIRTGAICVPPLAKGLVLGLLLVLPVAGCAKPSADDGVASANGGKPTASATASSGPRNPKDDQEAFLRFAQCMRDHGVPMDDPNFDGGGISITIPEGTDKTKVDAAQEQCKHFMPNNGEPPKANPEQQEQMRKFAECMREHGIVNFPDPSEDGGMMIDSDKLGVDPQGQQFKDAEKACEQYQPKPPGGGDGGPKTQQHVEGGGTA